VQFAYGWVAGVWRRWRLVAGVVAVLAALAGVALVVLMPPNPPGLVTRANAGRLAIGMTRAEVEAVLGPGTDGYPRAPRTPAGFSSGRGTGCPCSWCWTRVGGWSGCRPSLTRRRPRASGCAGGWGWTRLRRPRRSPEMRDVRSAPGASACPLWVR
jgi:hypothetical protein